MNYLELRPRQIKDAVERNIPVVMAAGSVEYHGPHMPVGSDLLIAETVLKHAEEKCVCIVMPSLPFSPTMFWAAGPEDGEFDFDPEALRLYALGILRGLLKIGFRRIYILQHHQGDNGLPALTLKRAAAEVIREFAKEWGYGWGRKNPEEQPEPGIFGMIHVAYIDSYSHYPSTDSERCPIGHGGKGETQLIMADNPECIDMDELDQYKKEFGTLPRWLKDAHLARKDEGERWIQFCSDGWAEELSRVT
ncbi:MAG: creatininase family protein [Ruminococcaceae bacterium]|nr:creatininase family protein [Oscillospiraceae bacterium]